MHHLHLPYTLLECHTLRHGTVADDEVIPAELCHIASDQRYTRKLPLSMMEFLLIAIKIALRLLVLVSTT
jgi:hypothetical protein